ncbi:MAG: leucine-rich repeat domain-containing protein [Clostridia bacterium]|nr:leucine-rich repeat domain-containing protein [Clostridia bacterium]
MKKKLLGIFTSIMLTALCAFGMIGCNNDDGNSNGNDVFIIEGTTVTGLTEYGKSLSEIVVPETVTAIGDSAFVGASATKIVLSSSLNVIGDDVFDGLSLEYNVKDGVKYLGNSDNDYFYLASVVSTEIESVTIDENCKIIGHAAFSLCKNLESVTIPNSVETIGNSAFFKNEKLTSANIGTGVTKIGNQVFFECEKLSTVNVPAGVTEIGYYAFKNCAIESITLPDGLTEISDSLFYGCSKLNSVNIPANVTSIGSGAFYECSALTELSLPANVTKIGNSAFAGCALLSSVNVPAGVTVIDNATFYGCSSLVSLELPNQLTTIKDYAFSSCSKLSGLEIPDTVNKMGANVFNECAALSFTISNGVKYIGNDANNHLWAIEVIADSKKGATSITLNENCKGIASSTIINCEKLTSIVIPSSISWICDRNLGGCAKLEKIYFCGTETAWETIGYETEITVYYFSELEPALNAEQTAYNGDFWHYGENKEIIEWIYVVEE